MMIVMPENITAKKLTLKLKILKVIEIQQIKIFGLKSCLKT
jgi:hypothetical protein